MFFVLLIIFYLLILFHLRCLIIPTKMYLTKTNSNTRTKKINQISNNRNKNFNSPSSIRNSNSNSKLSFLQQQSQPQKKDLNTISVNKNNHSHDKLNSFEILLKEFKKSKDIYQKVFADKKSQNYSYLEDIYVKYSNNLTKFFKNNKKGLQLTGNKTFENLPIELFLSEIEEYKKNILQKIKNKNLTYSNPNDNLSKQIDEKIKLTPLPSKSRLLMNSNKEINDFSYAERTAVYMRIVEYTHSLRTKEGKEKYERLLKEEKEKILFIMKKAVDIIQNWWLNQNKRNKLLSKEKKYLNQKYKKYYDTLFKKKGNAFIKYITSYVNKKILPSKRKFIHLYDYLKRKLLIEKNNTFSINNKKNKSERKFDSNNLKVYQSSNYNVSYMNKSISHNKIPIQIEKFNLKYNSCTKTNNRITFNNKEGIKGRKDIRFSIINEPKPKQKMRMQRVNNTLVQRLYENFNMKVFPTIQNKMAFTTKNIYINTLKKNQSIIMIQKKVKEYLKIKKLKRYKRNHILNHLLYLKENNEMNMMKHRISKCFIKWKNEIIVYQKSKLITQTNYKFVLNYLDLLIKSKQHEILRNTIDTLKQNYYHIKQKRDNLYLFYLFAKYNKKKDNHFLRLYFKIWRLTKKEKAFKDKSTQHPLFNDQLFVSLIKIFKNKQRKIFNDLVLNYLHTRKININKESIIPLLHYGEQNKYITLLTNLYQLNKGNKKEEDDMTFAEFVLKLIRNEQNSITVKTNYDSNNNNNANNGNTLNLHIIKMTKKSNIDKDLELSDFTKDILNDSNNYITPIKANKPKPSYTEYVKTVSSNNKDSQIINNQSEIYMSEDIRKAYGLLKKKSKSHQKYSIMLREDNEDTNPHI